jgi:hypothetical protein
MSISGFGIISTAGCDHTLSFADFVTYATEHAHSGYDDHIRLQHDLLSMARIELNFIGKVERFSQDIGRLLDHIGASDSLRGDAKSRINPSRHGRWPKYYTSALRDSIYRTYERDFDEFHYPRGVCLG